MTIGPGRSRLTITLCIVAVVAVLVCVAAAGYLLGTHRARTDAAPPSAQSVDAGFAQDMSIHHVQATVMAGYPRDNTDDPTIKLLAYEIETSQYFQIGEMQGWLQDWNLPRESSRPKMAWMGGHGHVQSDGLMPGMATPAEVDKLETLHGKALDVVFLQLMIGHHQGALPMSQYAAKHGAEPYLRDLAQSITYGQSIEIVDMERLLRQRGGAPLPPPTDH